jgi:hypothetical protein
MVVVCECRYTNLMFPSTTCIDVWAKKHGVDPKWREGISVPFIIHHLTQVLKVPPGSLHKPTFPVIPTKDIPMDDAPQDAPSYDEICEQVRALPLNPEPSQLLIPGATPRATQPPTQGPTQPATGGANRRAERPTRAMGSQLFKLSDWNWKDGMPKEIKVVCGAKGSVQMTGNLILNTQRFVVVCIPSGSHMSPTNFEQAAGMGKSKNWAKSLKVGEQTVLNWMSAQAQRVEADIALETPPPVASVPAPETPPPAASVPAPETPPPATSVPAAVAPEAQSLKHSNFCPCEPAKLPAGSDPSNPLLLRVGFDGTDISESDAYSDTYEFIADHNVYELFKNLNLGALRNPSV